MLQLMMSIEPKTGDFGDYYCIYLCIIKEQRRDKEESKGKGQKSSQSNVNDGLSKLNDCILWIHKWQNEHQWSANHFWSCVLGNLTSDRL
jgi:hypothetical protein